MQEEDVVKKIKFSLFFLLITLIVAPNVWATSITLDIIDQHPAVGEIVSMDINVWDVQGLTEGDFVLGLTAWDMRLQWNPEVLGIADVRKGPFLPPRGENHLFRYNEGSPGHCVIVEFSWSKSNETGSGLLASVDFNVLSSDYTPITIEAAHLVNLRAETIPIDSLTNTYIGTPENNPVPEPSTILLLGAGLLGVGVFQRKKIKRY